MKSDSESKPASPDRFRLVLYLAITLAFGAFFYTVLSNKNSRYNQRLEQSGARIDNRMQMMRRSYLQQDSVFRHEQDSLARIEQQQPSSK